MKLPVRVRLTLWYSTVLLVILVGVGAFVVARLDASLVRGVDESLAARGQVIAQAIAFSDQLPVATNYSLLHAAPVQDVIAQVVDRQGRVIDRAGEDAPNKPVLDHADVARSFRATLRRTVPSPVRGAPRYRVLARHLRIGAGRTVILIVGSEVEDVQRAVRGLVVLLLIAAPVALTLAAGGGWLLARAALRPVDVMTTAAASVDAASAQHSIPVPNTVDELSRLARTLNDMLERLHGAIAEERRFSADAAHELRTPLGIMRAEIDVALGALDARDRMWPVLESLREEVERLGRTTENLFLLAQLDEADALPMHRTTVDLLDLEQTTRARFARNAAGRDIELRVAGARVNVEGDPDALQQSLVNLVDNALKFTEPKGSVEVSVERLNGDAIVTVSDTGIGIPVEDVARIFDRFYRVDRARSRRTGGAGLGLAIVRRLVDAHNGTIDVTSERGLGTRVVIRLPYAEG